MSPEELKALLERLMVLERAATPAPWDEFSTPGLGGPQFRSENEAPTIDKQLACAARNALPCLLTEAASLLEAAWGDHIEPAGCPTWYDGCNCGGAAAERIRRQDEEIRAAWKELGSTPFPDEGLAANIRQEFHGLGQERDVARAEMERLRAVVLGFAETAEAALAAIDAHVQSGIGRRRRARFDFRGDFGTVRGLAGIDSLRRWAQKMRAALGRRQP